MKKIFLGLILLSTSLAKADEVRFLREDMQALQARVDVIEEADREILTEYYSVWNDAQSIGGMGLLIDAARRGVKVKVIVDALSNTIPKKTFAALLSLGGKNLEIRVYNPLSLNLLKATHRDHAKMIIADGETIITGGRNVGDKYFGVNTKRNFSDLDLMAKGKVAAAARENFYATWNSKIVKEVNLGQYELVRLHDAACTIVLLDINQERCPDVSKRTLRNLEKEKQRILDILKDIQTKQSDDLVTSQSGNDWFRESYNIQNVKFHSHEPAKLVSKETAVFNEDLLRTIGSAKSDVNIVSPYLIPTDNLIKVFTKILSKNVRIRIITNSLSSTDNLLAQTGYRKMKQKMIDMGIELYEYNGPDTIHAKTAVVDNRIVLVGTYNIDPRSAFLNREIGVIADDKENKGLAAELTKIIDGFRKNSTLIGKDKQLLHKEDLSKLPRSKKIILKSIEVILPLIRNQL